MTDPAGRWTVTRHSAKADDRELELFRGDEAKARERYDREVAALREGTVTLRGPDGTPEDRTVAPRRRTLFWAGCPGRALWGMVQRTRNLIAGAADRRIVTRQ
jgi:hypothetical protein